VAVHGGSAPGKGRDGAVLAPRVSPSGLTSCTLRIFAQLFAVDHLSFFFPRGDRAVAHRMAKAGRTPTEKVQPIDLLGSSVRSP
jgi:hypothetical protein